LRWSKTSNPAHPYAHAKALLPVTSARRPLTLAFHRGPLAVAFWLMMNPKPGASPKIIPPPSTGELPLAGNQVRAGPLPCGRSSKAEGPSDPAPTVPPKHPGRLPCALPHAHAPSGLALACRLSSRPMTPDHVFKPPNYIPCLSSSYANRRVPHPSTPAPPTATVAQASPRNLVIGPRRFLPATRCGRGS